MFVQENIFLSAAAILAALFLLDTANLVRCQPKPKPPPVKAPPPPAVTPPSEKPPLAPPVRAPVPPPAVVPPGKAAPVTPPSVAPPGKARGVGPPQSKPPTQPGPGSKIKKAGTVPQKNDLPAPPPAKGDPSMGFLTARRRRGLDEYWSMASQVANAMNPLSQASVPEAKTRSQIVTELYNNPVYASLFQNMPNLLTELDDLSSEQLSKTLDLFKVYTDLPQSVTPFFHQAIADMSSVAPTLADLPKFRIATELTLFVQSVLEPDSNAVSEISTYTTKLQRRAEFQPPSLGAIASFVGRVLIENLGQPLPIMIFNILREVLTLLIKAYIDGQLPHLKLPNLPNLPNLPKLPSIPKVSDVVKVPANAINNVKNQIPKVLPKVPKVPKPKFPKKIKPKRG